MIIVKLEFKFPLAKGKSQAEKSMSSNYDKKKSEKHILNYKIKKLLLNITHKRYIVYYLQL